ncbi:TonB-dependent receptor (plasmid) [Catenovulum sp. SX2]|uniref:TonB-dependent receptor n=1 Tax=Catenovulum sp. SX2 TaxID=3398614 RepID=UPI003F857615
MSRGNFKFTPSALALAVATICSPTYAQENNLEDETKAEQEEASEVIVVKGLRSSLIKAQEIKMNSDSFVDAIVAEDIGKLPDVTAAESLARITGIQVTRFNDEANAILIRGLPDVTTTYNGREFFTGAERRGALQDFPAQALAGIEVYKSGTAKLIEPGLAGLVNVRTRRPFDFDGEKIAGGVHYGYNDQSDKASPAANILYSNRWDSSIGEFGVLANATYARAEFYNGVRFNANWFRDEHPNWNVQEEYDGNAVVLPAEIGIYSENGERWRPSGNLAVQWRRDDNLEMYVEGIFQGYRGFRNRDWIGLSMTDWDWLNGTGDVHLNNITMVEGTDNRQIASVTKTGGVPTMAYRSTNKDRTDTYQYAVGLIWKDDTIKIESDLAYTDSEYKNNEWSFDTGLSFSPTIEADFLGDDGVLFSVPDWDVTDKSTYEMRGYFESRYKVTGKGTQWRTDVTYKTGWGDWLHTIETGVRFSDREATRSQGNRYAWIWDLHIPMTDLDFLEMEMTKNALRDEEQSFTQYLAPTRDSITNNAEKLQALSYEKLTDKAAWDAYKWNQPIENDPENEWLAKEKTYAVYLQTKSYFDIGDVGVDLLAGVRVAKTESSNYGISVVSREGERALEPREIHNDYIDVLPNISIRARLTDDLQLRAGYTETVTKPHFGDLNPALNISVVAPSEVDPDREVDHDAFGWGGNPDLNPMEANNYDISLEYYFTENGYISAAVFYKELDGFIKWYNRYVETPDYGTVRLDRPENAGEGKIHGWEVSLQTFFDYDFMPEPLHALGFTANVTSLEGEKRDPDENGNFGDFSTIPGLSKYTYNAALFYEKDGFYTRLSYNLRDTWITDSRASRTGGLVEERVKARNRLDFSIGYTFDDKITIYADMANILARPFRNNTLHPDGYLFPRDVRDEGRYFGVGMRFSY